jgi:hypothetical protein
VRKADEAEQRVLDERRALGHETLGHWANGQVEARRGAGGHDGGVARG